MAAGGPTTGNEYNRFLLNINADHCIINFPGNKPLVINGNSYTFSVSDKVDIYFSAESGYKVTKVTFGVSGTEPETIAVSNDSYVIPANSLAADNTYVFTIETALDVFAVNIDGNLYVTGKLFVNGKEIGG